MTKKTHLSIVITELENSSLRKKNLKTKPKASVTSSGLPQQMNLLSCHGYGLFFYYDNKTTTVFVQQQDVV